MLAKMIPKIVSVHPAEIVLVYGSLRTGGIETLLVRMANFFVEQNISVSVFCTLGGELASSLDIRVNVFYYKETSDLLMAARSYKPRHSVDSQLLLMSFDPISAARALRIEGALSRKCLGVAHVSGVFHPRAYFMTGERKDRVFLNSLVARAIGGERLFFMNEECRTTHATQWKTDLSNSPILALPVNHVDASWRPSGSTTVRVVSVGRLVDFKAYNLGAARIVKACLNQGVAITWDIYGDGPLRHSIEDEIEALGMSNHVRLMGELDYSTFSSTVAGYDLFVGMGTAALEAAMVGVPTVCAAVDEATRCYGYLHSLPFGNVGELQSKPPSVELVDLIRSYAMATQTQRDLLSQQSRSVAEKYGMPKFAEAIVSMTHIPNRAPSKFFKRVISDLYWFATESWLTKMVRQYLLKRVRAA